MPTPRRSCRFVLPLAILTLILATPLRAEVLSPESRVKAVTVYQDQALVTREARVSLPAGEHHVIFRDLPSIADPDSVRITGAGSVRVEIGGVDLKHEFQVPDLPPEHRQLQHQADDLARQQGALDDRKKSIASLREFVANLKASAAQESSQALLTRGFAVKSWQEAFEFLSGRLDALAAEDRDLERRSKDLAEKTEVARQSLARISAQAGLERWSASVSVSAVSGGELTLTLSYLAGNASWTPLYDARLEPTTGEVAISSQALVAQSTGEDWRDVAVRLATGRPSGGIDLPKLASIRLASAKGGFVNIVDGASVGFSAEYVDSLPVLGKNYRDTLAIGPGVTGGAPEAAPPPPPPQLALIKEAQASRREVAVAFDLPGRLDLPSDGQPHKHLISSRRAPGTIEYETAPRIVPAVYLVAKLVLPDGMPLLPGRVQHFVGGELVGASTISEHGGGDEIRLSFGQDDRLRIERKQLPRRLVHRGKDDEIDDRYVTSIENHLGRGAVINLRDLLPISGDDRIAVHLDADATTEGFSADPKDPGILTWKVSVPKDGKMEVSLAYSVRSARGLSLSGLD
jgi:uncharacterized protein (TIGR02231 family)